MTEILTQFLIGGLSGAISTVITHPLDVIKTRMQLQGELCVKRFVREKVYKNYFDAALKIYKFEGPNGFCKGLLPSIFTALIYNGIRLSEYHTYTSRLDDSKKFDVWDRLLAATIPVTLAGVLSNPFYMMKIQLISHAHPQIQQGHQHENDGSFMVGVKRHLQYNHWTYFFSGITYTIPLLFSLSAVQLISFDYTKHRLISRSGFEPGVQASALSAFIGGIFVSIFVCPGDVVMTRLCNQGYDKTMRGNLYNGFWDAWLKTIKAEGFFGLYKGFFMTYLRIGPHNFISLLLWDEMRNLPEMLRQWKLKMAEEEKARYVMLERSKQKLKKDRMRLLRAQRKMRQHLKKLKKQKKEVKEKQEKLKKKMHKEKIK